MTAVARALGFESTAGKPGVQIKNHNEEKALRVSVERGSSIEEDDKVFGRM